MLTSLFSFSINVKLPAVSSKTYTKRFSGCESTSRARPDRSLRIIHDFLTIIVRILDCFCMKGCIDPLAGQISKTIHEPRDKSAIYFRGSTDFGSSTIDSDIRPFDGRAKAENCIENPGSRVHENVKKCRKMNK